MNWKKGLIIPVIGLTLLSCASDEKIEPEKMEKTSTISLIEQNIEKVPSAKLISVNDGYANYAFTKSSGAYQGFGYGNFRHYQLCTFLTAPNKIEALLLPESRALMINSRYNLNYKKLKNPSTFTVEQFVHSYVSNTFTVFDKIELIDPNLDGIITNLKPIR